ncbi:MAG TPA: hypothetical protein DCW29_11615 [Janthinobacterium sp.]|nr:hypothetical protein [Janthinobacterium sp.]
MLKKSLLLATCACAVSACAVFLDPNDPGKDQQYVSVVNSLTWTNPLTGKRDGARSSWPLKTMAGQDEAFPLAQLKQCDGAGACAWGVMRAHRSLSAFTYLPGGVRLDMGLVVDVDRRQEAHRENFNTSLAIPSDVAALRGKKELRRSLTLQYGKVQHIDLDFGMGYDVCALRYDGAGRALDICEIPYI